ncbi:MAG: zinc ribbon domain-containing protein [Thomasclavelia sp.]|jgi:predicted nucleic acid-binding Zn ribbon protein|nr:zinc ribbon domain-containing protein [Thomasclavelia sp.]
MKECPYCHKDIPNDSQFCYHCGKELNGKKEEEKSKEKKLKKNPHQNSWGKLGLMLFFIGLLVFDFVISTVVGALGGNTKIPFIISLFIYIGSIVCGILSLRVDKQDRNKGYEPNGNKNYAYISIFLSIFIALVNLSQVILK